MRKVHLVVILLAGMIAAATVSAPSGAADPSHFFGVTGSTSCTWGNKADSSFHTYYRNFLTSDVSSSVTHVMTNTFTNTPIATYEHSSQTSLTDAVIMDANYQTYCGLDWDNPANKVHGHARCHSLTSSNTCQKFHVRIDTTTINDSRTTNKKRDSLLCHEIGHTLGLRHHTSTVSCMNTGLWTNDNKKYYGGHMKQDHLSAEY